MIPTLPGDSPGIQLVNECNRGLDQMNMDSIGRYLYKDFQHIIHPKSLGVPALDKEASLKRLSELGTGYGVGFTT